jgi:hypothetical protein
MYKRFYPLIAFCVLALVATACASPVQNGTGTPSSEDQVATIVASTLQAHTPVGSQSTYGPDPLDELLPHGFYYLGKDNNTGLTQVFRLDRDGTTMHQITFEPVDVNSYDVSPMDGSVAYVSNNQLLWEDANGSGRRLLVDGGPVDSNNPILNSLTNPAFSPDGQTIAYGLGGLNLYDLSNGSFSRVLEEIGTDPFTGLPAPRELYWPKNFSPDGTRILITTAIPNSDGISTAIFFKATNSLVRLTGEGAFFCCSEQAWTPDGSTLYAANSSMGMFGSGLWRVDGTTGVIATLVPGDAGDGTFNLLDEPYLAPDGHLYYFFAKEAAPDGFINRVPLQIVRSLSDGVTGRTVLHAENFQLMNEALWAPDTGFVIVAFAPMENVHVGGQAEITYFDGRPPVILTTFAQDMKWGP